MWSIGHEEDINYNKKKLKIKTAIQFSEIWDKETEEGGRNKNLERYAPDDKGILSTIA
jgi:hypothetical protein